MRPVTKQILVYLVLVFAFSSLPYFLFIHSGRIAVGNGMAVALIMWCPAFAALATCRIFGIGSQKLGWNWRPTRYVAWSYVIPILYALPVYLVTWATIRGSFAFWDFAKPLAAAYGFPNWPRTTTLLLAIPCYAVLGVISSTARALGEEIGWRGFLLPRLAERFGFTVACLLSGCIWAVWHYPGLLFADYNAGTNPAYALACFTLMVIADSYILGWLRLKSGSLWTAAILHASHNLFIQAIFDRMTAPEGRARYVTTEFGAGLVVTVGAFAAYFWSRRKELPSAAAGKPLT
jgi:membrane protease YdiL (CAAX protease family)